MSSSKPTGRVRERPVELSSGVSSEQFRNWIIQSSLPKPPPSGLTKKNRWYSETSGERSHI